VTVEELLRRPDEPYVVRAEPEELEALARADGLPGIPELSAEFKVERSGRDLRVRGEVRARVTQECVVTLEPFEVKVVEAVDVRFAMAPAGPPGAPRAGERMSRRRAAAVEDKRKAPPPPAFPAHEEDDPPEPIVDGRIDLGALAAEFMALGLDPYPRKPGAEFTPLQEDAGDDDESPFAGLAALRKDG
jgi:uncharacterized metal-binding protein YceD (DUF177 family)